MVLNHTRRIKYYYFKDRVLDIYYIMEKIVDHLNDLRSENGVGFRFRGTPRNLLQGFDFQDLATCDTPLKPHAVKLKLHDSGRGWTDLARSLQAITLFGKGFGELITPDNSLPAQGSDSCGFGTTLPKNKEYMGVCVSLLERIFNTRGNTQSIPWRLVDDIYWHTPGLVFESCQCRKGDSLKRARKPHRAQVLLPAKNPKLWGRAFKSPSSLESAGAVYFCNKWKIPLRLSHQMEAQSAPQDTNGKAQSDGATKVAIALSALHLDKSHNKQAGPHTGLEDARC